MVNVITPEQLAANGSEHGNQAALFCWAQQNLNSYPELKYLFAIPNGGMRDKITAAKLKAEGVKLGVPDMCLPVSRSIYHGLFIELKKLKGGVLSKEQEHWINWLNEQGYYAMVCRGWEEAREILIWYLRFANKP